MMNYLNWELDVISRAIDFPNLTGAAGVIGISQPQLSRIVRKLEADCGFKLLNREAKRSVSWTNEAHKLVELYRQTFLNFKIALDAMQDNATQSYVRVGALDGLADHAMKLCHELLSDSDLQTVELDLYDLPDLEERFLAGKLDLIFSLRQPGRSKSMHVRTLGYQRIEQHGYAGGIAVKSVFENNSSENSSASKTNRKAAIDKSFVSNSLAMREHWIKHYNGIGTLPSKIHQRKAGKGLEYPALLIGRPGLSDKLWRKITESSRQEP